MKISEIKRRIMLCLDFLITGVDYGNLLLTVELRNLNSNKTTVIEQYTIRQIFTLINYYRHREVPWFINRGYILNDNEHSINFKVKNE